VQRRSATGFLWLRRAFFLKEKGFSALCTSVLSY